MVGSEFGVNNMEACIHPALYQWLLAQFGTLSMNWAFLKRHSLPEYCFGPCPSPYHGYFHQDNAPCYKAKSISN